MVINAISEAQAAASGGPAGMVDLGPASGKLQLDRVVPLAGAPASKGHALTPLPFRCAPLTLMLTLLLLMPASQPTQVGTPPPPSRPWHTELRRHKRAFLKLATNMAYSRIADATTAQRLFVEYLAAQQQQQ